MNQFLGKSPSGLFATQTLTGHVIRGAVAFALLYLAIEQQHLHPVASLLAGLLALIRGAEELTERHEAKYFARVPNIDLRIDLVRALESLPDIYREVILLRDMEQLTIGEVADHLRITREACKSRIHRGRALLREYLQGDESRGGKK